MNPVYQKARFQLSILHLRDAPPDQGFEVAFAGRSNAGKSSAVNVITSQKGLARTSKIPGRTRQLIFFEIDEQRRLVDLPGYGYAKVPAAVQAQWHQAMDRYFRSRQSLRGVFLLMDIRHPLTVFDQRMIELCGHRGLPLHIALAKSDKLKAGAARNALLNLRKALSKANVAVTAQLFSAPERTGTDEAHRILDQWLQI